MGDTFRVRRSKLVALALMVLASCNTSPRSAPPAADTTDTEPSAARDEPQAQTPAPAPNQAPAQAAPGEPGAGHTQAEPPLNPGEELAYPVQRAALGPGGDATLVLVRRDHALAGFMLAPGAGGAPTRIDLPALDEGMLEKVREVFFIDADGRAGIEVVITSLQMTGVGPEGAMARPFHAVVAWDGARFVRLADIEARIAGLSTRAEIETALRSRAP
jgi:hypothetical protein